MLTSKYWTIGGSDITYEIKEIIWPGPIFESNTYRYSLPSETEFIWESTQDETYLIGKIYKTTKADLLC